MSYLKTPPILPMEAGPERELMACFLERVKLLRMNPLSKIYPSKCLTQISLISQIILFVSRRKRRNIILSDDSHYDNCFVLEQRFLFVGSVLKTRFHKHFCQRKTSSSDRIQFSYLLSFSMFTESFICVYLCFLCDLECNECNEFFKVSI